MDTEDLKSRLRARPHYGREAEEYADRLTQIRDLAYRAAPGLPAAKVSQFLLTVYRIASGESFIPPNSHPEDFCHRCFGPLPGWVAPSPLWNRVMRGDGERELFDGIVCPTCFAMCAQEAGVASEWRLEAQRVNVPLETVTPSGRVWNPVTWMFEGPERADG